jgi:hypothetical protein
MRQPPRSGSLLLPLEADSHRCPSSTP